MKALIGTKIGMGQIVDQNGLVVAVSFVQASPNVIMQRKTVETDGYTSVQVGAGIAKNPTKQQTGHAKKHANLKDAPSKIIEIRTNADTELPESLSVETFTVGDIVDVTGITKGKGFAGTIKRHNFMRSRKTHGGNGDVRKPGSIGSMYPQKVFKGKRMAGQMGATRNTVKNLSVAFINPDTNIIGLKGAIPGPRKGSVVIKGVQS